MTGESEVNDASDAWWMDTWINGLLNMSQMVSGQKENLVIDWWDLANGLVK